MTSSIHSRSCAFSFPLPGKPDPDQSWDPQKGDDRPRVFRQAQQGHDCVYTVYEMLRQHIGNHPPPGLEGARKIEERLSQWRNQENENMDGYKVEMKFVNGWIAPKQVVSEEQQKQLLSKDLEDGTIQALLLGNDPEKVQKCLGFITSFLQTKEKDLLNFTMHRLYLRQIAAAQSLLMDLGDLAGRACIEMSIQSDGIQVAAMRGVRHIWVSMAGWYNLKGSHWHPAQSIQCLIQEIEQQGPLKVEGHFGKSCYEVNPFKLPYEIGGRSIFGWKPGAMKKSLHNQLTHAVLIVGSKSIKGAECVYYIDPTDPSDPADITTQKVYVISYNTLRRNIIDVYGMRWRGPNGEIGFTPEQPGVNPYAVHR